jgi:hypothetical protein
MRCRCPRRPGRHLTASLLLGLALFLPSTGQPVDESGSGGREPCYDGPLYMVPLRIHGGESGRSRGELVRVREEINRIWLSQAGICFPGEIVDDDEPLGTGMDIWFVPSLDGFNGYFFGPNAIRVRDFPELRPAANPSADGAARTAAHELGHALGLVHRQGSEENLMRSRTFGWRLDAGEVVTARRAASATGAAGREGDCPCPAGE